MDSWTDKDINDAAELFPSLWCVKHGIKNEAGLPVEFKDHKFMIDMMNDMSPLQVILKAPQVGMTTTEIIKSFYVAKKLGKAIIYTLPTDGDIKDMAGGKVNRIIAQNPVLSQWVKDHDSVEQKSVGDSIIYYRGTWTQKAAMMVSSDLNIHDEVDASSADVITQYETRLQAKADGWRWYFSHPSIAGFGVDIYWEKSDKKEWVIKCPLCSEEQILTWPQSISRKDGEYVCKFCDAILADSDRRNGEWKATAVGEFSGYHVSQLMCPWISAKKILEAKDDERKTEQYFYNYVLGLPYVGSENKISSDVVLKNVVKEVNEQNDRIIIGVDTGLPIHYTIGNKQGIFYYGQCQAPSATYDPYDELERFLLRWPTSLIIADQGGDLIGIRKLQAKYPGRVYLVYYVKDRKQKEWIQWGEDENLGTVKVDRNNYYQLMVEQLREFGRIRLNSPQDQPLSKTIEDWKPWAKHFDNVYREIKTVKDNPGKDVSTNYGVELIWKRNGPDHYTHTLLYLLVGLDKFGGDNATFIKRTDNFMKGVPIASRIDNSIPARRIMGKKMDGFVDF
jgi:phage terminase large subunit GpA